MLEYLYCSIGGFFSSYRTFTVFNQDSRLVLDYYKIQRNLEGPHYHDIWTNRSSYQWLIQFEDIHCEEWQDHYFEDILDGTQWELIYKCTGLCERQISGSNAFPDTWPQFMKWINAAIAVLPEVDVADLDDIMMALYESPIYRNGGQKKRKDIE